MTAPSMESIPGSFAALKVAFLPEKTANVDRTIQFDFTGREAGTWNLTVRNSAFEYGEGPAQTPNATITVDSDDWLKILRNELNATTAFMGGKLKVSPASAAMDLMSFQTWFAR